MKKILIHGFYGQGNLGDEAILTTLLREFGKYPGLEVVVASSNPEQVTESHGVRAVHSHSRRAILRRLWKLKTSNLFILGGGGLLKDYGDDSASLKRWLDLLTRAKRFGVKTALCAVGVEYIRFEKSKALLRKALKNVDMITVRDENSRSILQDIGVDNDIEVTTDPTVLLGTAVEGKPRGLTSPPRVIVSVRHWFDKGFYIEDSEANRVFMESLASAVNYLVEQHSARVDFVPMRTTSYDDDRTVAAEVVSLMKHGDKVKVHTRAPEVDEFVRMTGRSSLIIGMRLHSLIIGASSGVPIIGLEYMPKVRAFMDSISQSEYSLDLNRVTSKQIIHTIEKTLSEYDIRHQKMISEISSLQKIAKNTLMKLVQLSVCSD